ncbi:hypothetical protein PspR84_02565 [Pseudomonas sp. R84]|nr:hypothetical protein PspR84_02565 [Pseudomonas sp. R84]
MVAWNAFPLWERACSRRRSVSRHQCCLTHRFREQARSHSCSRAPVKSARGSNITLINHPVQPLFPRLRLGPTPISGKPPCPRRCSVPAIWLSSCTRSLMPRA